MSEGRYIKRTELGGSPWVERFDGRIIDCGRPTTFRRVGDAINACALANYADREARKECAASLAALTAERDAAIERTNVDRYALQQKDNAIEEFQRIVATLTARVAELEGALASIGFVGEGDFKEETPAAKPETTETPAPTCGTLVWEEGRTIKFDETMVFGVGYDFEAMLLTTEEADTSIGRFAVWSDQIGGNAKWSLYGGTDGWFKSGFSSKEEAQASVQEMHQRALKPTCGTCGTCGGTKQIVSSGHRAVYFRPCPDCAAAEGGVA